MNVKKPERTDDLMCPQWRKPVAKVCHKCPWYQQVMGKNPQTGDETNAWGCAIELLPFLTINIARETAGVHAATNSFRNEMVERSTLEEGLQAVQRRLDQMQRQPQIAAPPAAPMIEDKG